MQSIFLIIQNLGKSTALKKQTQSLKVIEILSFITFHAKKESFYDFQKTTKNLEFKKSPREQDST